MGTNLSFLLRERSRLLQGLTLLAFVAIGCGTEPCPEGTKQDGDVCRRLPKMMTGTQQAAGSAAGDLDEGDVDNPTSTGKAKAGSGGTAADGGKGGAAGSASKAGAGGSAGKAGSGGASAGKGGSSASESEDDDKESAAAGAKAGAGGAAGGGKAGASGAAAGSGAAGKAGADAGGASGAKAGAGGAADKAGAGGKGGEGGASSGSGGAGGKGGEGGEAAAGAGGQGTDPMFPKGSWFCVQIGFSCTCIPSDASRATDECDKPKPTCCYADLTETTPNCQCWPEDSRECMIDGNAPTSVKVPACPPN